MWSLFRRKNRKAPAPARRPWSSFRPSLEALEDRLCLSAGALDPTFGSGGIVNLPTTTYGSAHAVAVQPDGKVVITGEGRTARGADVTTVERLNPDGTLDTAFNGTGSVTIAGTVGGASVALQPDGKILIGSDISVKQGKNYVNESAVARLNTNGTLDTTFGHNGLWVAASPSGPVEDLAVLTDPAHPGTVTGIVGAVWGQSFEAVKLTPAGVPDQTFGAGGLAVFTNISGHAVSVAADPLNGEFYLAGFSTPPNSSAGTGILAAVTPTGALDTTFGGGAGYVLGDSTGEATQFNDVAVQTVSVNGQQVSRLIVAGGVVQTPVSAFVTAYTLGGALDTTFGIGGSFTLAGLAGGYASEFNSLAVEADGSIVVGGDQLYGSGSYPPSEMLVGHLTASGVADTSFGPDGTGFTIVQNGVSSGVSGLAIDPRNGDILACGTGVIRLTAS
jgi:uncharacterized delta-60 repeat protein